MTTQLFRPALVGITFVPAAVAAIVDRRTHRVPSRLVALTLLPALVLVLIGGDPARRLVALAFGAALMALPLLLVHLVTPAAMGFGDVKLAAALGAGLGVLEPRLAVPALAAASGLTLVVAACRRRPAMPFAPGLVTGAAAAVALGALAGWRVA